VVQGNSLLHYRFITGAKSAIYDCLVTVLQGNSALHYAMSGGQFGLVSALLDTGKCDITRQNKTGCTVVMLASLVQLNTEEDRNVVRRLFQLGDINQQASLVRTFTGGLYVLLALISFLKQTSEQTYLKNYSSYFHQIFTI